jgi:hypothetical protein
VPLLVHHADFVPQQKIVGMPQLILLSHDNSQQLVHLLAPPRELAVRAPYGVTGPRIVVLPFEASVEFDKGKLYDRIIIPSMKAISIASPFMDFSQDFLVDIDNIHVEIVENVAGPAN